ncbi:hypothetical protein, partial [Zunongwangia endophytica]
MDRNGVIQLLSSDGILRTHDGQFLYPGTLVKDKTYRPLTNKKISSFLVYKNQFVYLDDKSVFSNAWAGDLYITHDLTQAKLFAGSDNFEFLISDGKILQLLSKDGAGWKGDIGDEVLEILYDSSNKLFWILGTHSVSSFDPNKNILTTIEQEEELTSFTLFSGKLIVGTSHGYAEIDTTTSKIDG